jgi:hypothetical protein
MLSYMVISDHKRIDLLFAGGKMRDYLGMSSFSVLSIT